MFRQRSNSAADFKNEPKKSVTTFPVAVIKPEPHEPISSDENIIEEVEKILSETVEDPIPADDHINKEIPSKCGKKQKLNRSQRRIRNAIRLKKELEFRAIGTQHDTTHEAMYGSREDTHGLEKTRLHPYSHYDQTYYHQRPNILSTSTSASKPSDTVYLDYLPLNDVLTNDLKVSIVDRSYHGTRINSENYLKIESFIFDEIFHSSIRNPSIPGPKYNSHERFRGFRIVSCDSILSLVFLKDSIRRMGELWPGARLEVIPLRELPSLPRVFINMPCGEQDVGQDYGKKLIQVIKAQNSDLNTTNWGALHVGQPLNSSVFVVLTIDDESLHVIKKKGNSLTIGMREIIVNTAEGTVQDELERFHTEADEKSAGNVDIKTLVC